VPPPHQAGSIRAALPMPSPMPSTKSSRRYKCYSTAVIGFPMMEAHSLEDSITLREGTLQFTAAASLPGHGHMSPGLTGDGCGTHAVQYF